MTLNIKPIGCRPLLNVEDPDVQYKSRPGAYAIILNSQQQLLTIKEPTGIFLPGGGQDEGEDLLEALTRELFEELHVTGVPVAYLLAADDCRFSPVYQQQFHIQSHYIFTRITDDVELITEDRSEAMWLDLSDAAESLTRDSDKWLCQSLISKFRLLGNPVDVEKLKREWPQAIYWQNGMASDWHEVEYVLFDDDVIPVAGLADGLQLEQQVLAWIKLSLSPGEYEVRGLYLKDIAQARQLQDQLQSRFKGIRITDPGGLFVQ